jgi:hypothetical protein
MDRRLAPAAMTGVAACTTAAAHRRDHDHPAAGATCHPHAVEVVNLGASAVAVCHDCGTDTGFLPQRQAQQIATGHRSETLVGSVALPLRAVG